MRSSLLNLLILCESLLLSPSVAAESKGKSPTPNACADPRRGCMAVLQRLSRAGTGPLSRPRARSAKAKASPKDEQAISDKAAEYPERLPASVQTHRVKQGETLPLIASRYEISQSDLLALNGFALDETIKQGQILFVPSGRKTLPERVESKSVESKSVESKSVESKSASWRRFAGIPKQKGQLELATYSARFAGVVVEKNGSLRPAAAQALNSLLGAGGKHPAVPERLIRLLVKVSDTFGGRAIHIVSGYRQSSYFEDSRHRHSAAVDFSIAGIPNAVLCEYLRELDDVGVGYYPNSTFVHLDSRKESAYWVDYAGPGQPPRSTPTAPRPQHGSKQWLMAELDSLVNQNQKALQHAVNGPPASVPEPNAPSAEPSLVELEPPRAPDTSVASTRDSLEPGAL